jgi:hypothetical protein
VATHWGHDFRPLITANCAAFSGTLCTYTADAEQFWYRNGFWPGWRPGNAWRGCGPWRGWVTVCTVSRSQIPAGKHGVTWHYYVNNPTTHLDANVVYICADCGLYSTQLRDVVRHEYGHAIGLGHTRTYPSIMADPITWSEANEHDRASVASMYARHDDTVYAGQQLDADESILSRDARFRGLMQADGNFVVNAPWGAMWATGTNGWPNVAAKLQTDCNFVLYSGNQPIWATNTWGYGNGCRLVMQTDGNLVLYTSWGSAVWALW